jgi:hypothetical protein
MKTDDAIDAIVYRLSSTIDLVAKETGGVVLQKNAREPLSLGAAEADNLRSALDQAYGPEGRWPR